MVEVSFRLMCIQKARAGMHTHTYPLQPLPTSLAQKLQIIRLIKTVPCCTVSPPTSPQTTRVKKQRVGAKLQHFRTVSDALVADEERMRSRVQEQARACKEALVELGREALPDPRQFKSLLDCVRPGALSDPERAAAGTVLESMRALVNAVEGMEQLLSSTTQGR